MMSFVSARQSLTSVVAALLTAALFISAAVGPTSQLLI